MVSKKTMLPAVLAVMLTGTTFFGLPQQAHAQSNNNPLSGLVAFLSQKFGLEQNQVQSAINDYHKEHKDDRQKNMADREKARLDALVKAGKITSTQEQAILDELAALKKKYDPANAKNLTKEERKQQLQAEQTEIKLWAKAQGIDPKYLMHGFGGGGMHKKGEWNKPTPTATP